MSHEAFNQVKAGLESAIEYAAGVKAGHHEHRIELPVVDVRQVREGLGLSQEAFAEAFGVSVGTVRNWEQGRRIPRGPARLLLLVIEREPDAVRRTLDAVA